ncbi:MAG: DUF308 domain-containing protein [Paludibacteraceae bacterium]|nr:DUF308 domain-containing protein [Paludibacteraceae bacterium]
MKQNQNQEGISFGKELKKQVRYALVEQIAYSIMLLGLGVMFVLTPELSGHAVCLVTGIFLISAGVVAMAACFARSIMFGGFSLLFGILLLFAGILFLANPEVAESMLTFIIGMLIIADGAYMFVGSIECAKFSLSNWFLLLIMSLLVLAIGAVVIIGNFGTVMIVAGYALIVDAIFRIITSCVFGSRINNAKRQINALKQQYYTSAEKGE